MWKGYCIHQPFGLAIPDDLQQGDFLVAALHHPMDYPVVIAGGVLSWLGSRVDAFSESQP